LGLDRNNTMQFVWLVVCLLPNTMYVISILTQSIIKFKTRNVNDNMPSKKVDFSIFNLFMIKSINLKSLIVLLGFLCFSIYYSPWYNILLFMRVINSENVHLVSIYSDLLLRFSVTNNSFKYFIFNINYI
jgi:hypothetical protein